MNMAVKVALSLVLKVMRSAEEILCGELTPAQWRSWMDAVSTVEGIARQRETT